MYTDFDRLLCHSVFPDLLMQWLNIKGLWEECIIWECSCGMKQNAMHGVGFLWLHTIIMSLSANNGEAFYLIKTLKPLQFKRILFSVPPIVQKPILMEGCHQLVCSPVVFLNSKSWCQHLKLWSVTAFQQLKVGKWIDLWKMHLCLLKLWGNEFICDRIPWRVCKIIYFHSCIMEPWRA